MLAFNQVELPYSPSGVLGRQLPLTQASPLKDLRRRTGPAVHRGTRAVAGAAGRRLLPDHVGRRENGQAAHVHLCLRDRRSQGRPTVSLEVVATTTPPCPKPFHTIARIAER